MKITLDPEPYMRKCKAIFRMESVEVGPFGGRSVISQTDFMNFEYTTKEKLIEDITENYIEFCEESKNSEIFKKSKNVIIYIELMNTSGDTIINHKMDISISDVFYKKNYLYVLEKMRECR